MSRTFRRLLCRTPQVNAAKQPIVTPPTWRGRRATAVTAAFTLYEVMFAVLVFLVMTFMACTAIAAASRATRFGSNYTQATSIGQHVIDQLQNAGWGAVTNPTSSQFVGVIVDTATPTGGYPAAGECDCNFTDIAHLNDQFFVAKDSSNHYLPNSAQGTLTLKPYGKKGSMLLAQISITWKTSNNVQSSYYTETVIIQNGATAQLN